MFTNHLFNLLIVFALMIAACAPAVAPTPTSPIAASAPTLASTLIPPAGTSALIVAASPVLEPNTDAETWSEGLPPHGVWQATLTPDDFVQRGVSHHVAEEEWAGVYTWTFHDGNAQLDFVGPIETATFTCLAEYAAVGGVVSFTFNPSILAGPCAGAIDDVQWRFGNDGLHFHLVASSRGPFVEIKTTYEAKPFQKIPDL